jgi:integration host factor subunit beta
MTKSELIARLAERYPQLVAKDADYAVKTILDAMADALATGQRIEIRGFGSFALNRRPPRIGRNPKSGDKVMVPEKRVRISSQARSCANESTRWSGNRFKRTEL